MKVYERSVPCFGLILLLTVFANSQQKLRTVENGLSYPNQPIEMVGKELGNERFVDNKGVMGDQDWLNKITLSVKNVSNKNIMSFEINLLIKKEGRILMGIPIYFYSYAKPEYSDVLTAEGAKKIGVLRPGEIVKVKISDSTMQMYRKHLVKNEVENIDRVTVEYRGVYFVDHTDWMFGQESRPDPNNPGRRIRIDRPEQKVSNRFSDWLEYFLPAGWTYSNNPIAFIFPAGGRNFFAQSNPSVASPPPPECIWFVREELTSSTCSTFTTTHGCQGDDQNCIFEKFDDAVHTSDPGGGALKGIMIPDSYRCKLDPNIPPPPPTVLQYMR